MNYAINVLGSILILCDECYEKSQKYSMEYISYIGVSNSECMQCKKDNKKGSNIMYLAALAHAKIHFKK
jgi:hypothetical protein